MPESANAADTAEPHRQDLDLAAAERALDEALEASFPASDPAALTRRA